MASAPDQLEELREEVIDAFDVDTRPTPDAVDSSRKRAFIFYDSPPSLGVASGSGAEDIGLLGRAIGCGVASVTSLGWCHAGNF